MRKPQKTIDNREKIPSSMRINFKNQSLSIEKASKPQKETCQMSRKLKISDNLQKKVKSKVHQLLHSKVLLLVSKITMETILRNNLMMMISQVLTCLQ